LNLAAVREGDTLVVPKLDRLARSVPDARAIGDDLATRGIKLSLGGQVYDPTDPLAGYKAGGWADLWLFGAGVGAALAVGAFVTALTLPAAQPGTRDVLWVLTGAGAVILVLCLVGYLTQRRDHGREISPSPG
jgi:hypothetical protein